MAHYVQSPLNPKADVADRLIANRGNDVTQIKGPRHAQGIFAGSAARINEQLRLT